jgi:predicted nucleic acid-binding Zn ribbon protein
MSLEFSPDLFEAIQEALPDETKETKENKNEVLRKERERQKKETWLADRERDRIEEKKRAEERVATSAVENVFRWTYGEFHHSDHLPYHNSQDIERVLSVARGISLRSVTPQGMAERYQDVIQWCQPISTKERRRVMEVLMAFCHGTTIREAMAAFYDMYAGRAGSAPSPLSL